MTVEILMPSQLPPSSQRTLGPSVFAFELLQTLMNHAAQEW